MLRIAIVIIVLGGCALDRDSYTYVHVDFAGDGKGRVLHDGDYFEDDFDVGVADYPLFLSAHELNAGDNGGNWMGCEPVRDPREVHECRVWDETVRLVTVYF